MSDTFAEASPGTGGPKFEVDRIAGVDTPYSKQAFGASGQRHGVEDIAGKRLPTDSSLKATAVVAGQPVVAQGGSSAALPNVPGRKFRIRSHPNNDQANPIEVGATAGFSAGSGMPLFPGDWYPDAIEVDNLNRIHALSAAAGQKLCYFAEV